MSVQYLKSFLVLLSFLLISLIFGGVLFSLFSFFSSCFVLFLTPFAHIPRMESFYKLREFCIVIVHFSVFFFHRSINLLIQG